MSGTSALRRRDLLAGLAAASFAPAQSAGGIDFEKDVIAAPRDPAAWKSFREELARWRAAKRHQLRYQGSLYDRPEFAWVTSTFSCCFVMLCDEMFYDRRQSRYTVESFLDHGAREFGGYDAVVLWHAYPRIGVDDRNQFDIYRDMPGGLAGLKEVGRVLHARGVRLFIDYNPWDRGTRREPVSDLEALASLVKAIGADGIFLDTMNRGAAGFRALLDAARPGVVLEGEGALPLESVHDHHMSWAQGFRDSETPGILRNKWFERRHMQHQIRRWDRDHTAELQMAWINGSGMLVWENVFGSWLGWSERDRSILRSMLPVQRRFHRLFSAGEWTPLVEGCPPGIYASLWQEGGLRLWAVVNRSEQPVQGTLLTAAGLDGARYFDLIQGKDLGTGGGQQVVLRGSIGPRGVGAFLSASPASLPSGFAGFLESQRTLAARSSLSAAAPVRQTRLVPVQRRAAGAQLPPEMAPIGPVRFKITTEFRVRECGFYDSQSGIPMISRGLHKPALFERDVALEAYAIDLTPVTNQQFAAFLKASGYRPEQPGNFLKHWSGGAPPRGLEDHPVVYVGLDDARAYARWAGKRLPTEEEWQYAAEGPRAYRYPWGDTMEPGRSNSGESGGTTSVTAFPSGRSPFGCYDMCGNTWEWTESERSDGRTRFCILKGGSWYRALGSDWYADGGPRPCNFALKFLLMWPGLDRCATVGFRCAVDRA